MGSLINKDFEVASSFLSKKQQRAAKRRQKKTDPDPQDVQDIKEESDVPGKQDENNTHGKQHEQAEQIEQAEQAAQVEQDEQAVQTEQDHDNVQAQQAEAAAVHAIPVEQEDHEAQVNRETDDDPQDKQAEPAAEPIKQNDHEAQDKHEEHVVGEPNSATHSSLAGSPDLSASEVYKRYSKLSSPPVHHPIAFALGRLIIPFHKTLISSPHAHWAYFSSFLFMLTNLSPQGIPVVVE